MTGTKKAIVYLDIESLLDLRQGFLLTQTDRVDELTEYVLGDEYNYRSMDSFPKFTENDYREAMANPTKAFLEGSLITYLLGIVQTTLSGTENSDKFNGEKTVPELWFNTYPFKLSEEELERLRDLLFVKLGRQHLIEMVYFPLSDVSPRLLSDGGFISAFIYDFTGWINIHGEALQKTTLHECPLHFAPVFKILPTEEEMKLIEKTGFGDMFSYTEFALSPLVKVNFLPMLFYSNIIVAQRHVFNYHEETKEKVSTMANTIVVPEEMLKNVMHGKEI